MNQLNMIWGEVLTMMASETGKRIFNSWLRQTKATHSDGNIIYVEVPNQFTRDWIEARFALGLRKTLRHITSREWELRFVIPAHSPVIGSRRRPLSKPLQPTMRAEGAANSHTPGKPEDNGESKQTTTSSILNQRYTFDTFVVGNSNRFAHAASLAVAEAPAKAYNPLFLYGGVGLGKTHLMHAIGHYALDSANDLRAVYVTSETFTNDLIHAIGKKSMAEFRDKYRNVDILMVDDIQFVAGKESTQEEFFHTFNSLYEANKQLIISSDRPPKEIPTLEERLRSRFEWGLTTDIQPPDLETRIAILRKKADVERIEVLPEVLSYIANHVQSNIRELEGAFVRVVAYADLNHTGVTLDSAQEVLKDLLATNQQKPLTIEKIQKTVSTHYGIKPAEMKSKKRTRSISFPRQIAMYLSRELTDHSLPRIGEQFGGRDHTTVIHACDKLQRDMKLDPSLQVTIRDLIDSIHQN